MSLPEKRGQARHARAAWEGRSEDMVRTRNAPSFFERVYEVVEMIPEGQVATYGQIAAIVSHRQAARTVGWALASLQAGTDVRWHRVINTHGVISLRNLDQPSEVQRLLLAQEGIATDQEGRIDLQAHRWRGLDWPEVEALRRKWNRKLQGDNGPGVS